MINISRISTISKEIGSFKINYEECNKCYIKKKKRSGVSFEKHLENIKT